MPPALAERRPPPRDPPPPARRLPCSLIPRSASLKFSVQHRCFHPQAGLGGGGHHEPACSRRRPKPVSRLRFGWPPLGVLEAKGSTPPTSAGGLSRSEPSAEPTFVIKRSPGADSMCPFRRNHRGTCARRGHPLPFRCIGAIHRAAVSGRCILPMYR